MTPRLPIRRPMSTPTPPAPRMPFALGVWLFFIYMGLLGVGIQLSGIKDAIRAQTAAIVARPVAAPAKVSVPSPDPEADRLRAEAQAIRERIARMRLDAARP